MVTDADTGRIIGITALAQDAGDLAAAGVYMLEAGMTTSQVANLWSPYLTMAEGLKLTAQASPPTSPSSPAARREPAPHTGTPIGDRLAPGRETRKWAPISPTYWHPCVSGLQPPGSSVDARTPVPGLYLDVFTTSTCSTRRGQHWTTR